MSRCCSQCGTNGHNSRTCAESAAAAAADDVGGDGTASGEIMLFGVRVKVDPMRKSVSMNNLSQYVQPHDLSSGAGAGSGYASADEAVHHQSVGGRERKRGVPWTEDEHKLFLLGLQRVGKGDWRGISKNFVKTRTPTQVASHAQKYFLRQNNLNRRRRRSSLFDITTDSVTPIPMEEEQVHQDVATQVPPPTPMQPQQLPLPETTNASGFSVVPFPMAVGPVLLPVQIERPIHNLDVGQGEQLNSSSMVLVQPIPLLPISKGPTTADLDLNEKLEIEQSPLSLMLSLSCDQNQSSSRHSAFQVMPSFNNVEGMIRVA